MLSLGLQSVLISDARHESFIVLLVIEDGALVVHAVMFSPWTHAVPTEFVAARVAAHHVAALILFDRVLALGAVLRVGGQPHGVLALSAFFDDLLLCLFAVDWLMR